MPKCKQMLPCQTKNCQGVIRCLNPATARGGYCDEHVPEGSFGSGPGVQTRWGDPTNNPLIPEIGNLRSGGTGTNWLGTQVRWTGQGNP